jgi:uncharacterized protein YndB with AHSA1/START domain
LPGKKAMISREQGLDAGRGSNRCTDWPGENIGWKGDAMVEQTVKYTGQVHEVVAAPVERVWEALTRPELIKQYLFGTEVETDWKVGSPITYRGLWQGKPYEDKGRILEMVPQRRIKSTYWSAFSGLPDRPENYQIVTYELTPGEGVTAVAVSQENISSAAAKAESEHNWQSVLAEMKKILETPRTP